MPPPGLSKCSVHSVIRFTKPKIKTNQCWLNPLLSSMEPRGGARPSAPPPGSGSPAPGLRCGALAGSLRSSGRGAVAPPAPAFVTAPWGGPETPQREFLKCFPALPGLSAALSHVRAGSRTDTKLGQKEPSRARRGARGLAVAAERGSPRDGGCPRCLSPPAAAPPRPPGSDPPARSPACPSGTMGH